jgi:predicted acylesterase/phospholipase RssA
MTSADSEPKFVASDFEGSSIRRLCDIVMKGGITSGVVYPNAICELATTYVIKNIGGTSVGAIAAAITAAAEYRRRERGSGAGYAELAKLPEFLGRPGALLALFAPDRMARALLKVALIPIGNAPALSKWLRLIGTLLLLYWWIPLLAIAVIFAATSWATWPLPSVAIWRCLIVSVLFGLIAAVAGTAVRFAWQAIAVLDRNSFGWCHGYSREADARLASVADVTQLRANAVPPLFNWLEGFIAQTSGKLRSAPLTFGDLWHAKQPAWHGCAPTERCIDFRMVTTCLTLGRPFELPFDPTDSIGEHADPSTDDDKELRPSIYFRKEDLEKYFSAEVVEHMANFGKKTDIVNGDYYRFPAAENVPIIVATRLSMSFPVLFCAFPLYALDGTGTMQRLWFSDGGLTSNFPIHFFDSPLPQWPTFAIDLLNGDARAFSASFAPGAVFMEDEVPRGVVSPWNKLDCGDKRGNVLAFGSAILDAARNWQDVTLGRLPGNASRIVGIRLSADEGGLNLKMPPTTIEKMARLGVSAGSKLLDVFARGAPDPQGWRSHRWLRYRAIMGAVTRWAAGYEEGYRKFIDLPAQATYESLIGEEVEPARQPRVQSVTRQLASLPLDKTFFEIEEQPIAVLPTRPVI